LIRTIGSSQKVVGTEIYEYIFDSLNKKTE
jgi:hypothetical protein